MLEKVWKKILRRELLLWPIPAFGLWLVSMVYRVGFALKRGAGTAQVKLDLPVVSVGNIAVGGTGKTTLVAFLGRFLLNEGIRVGVVSSGYGRAATEPVVQPGYKIIKMDAATTGDEVRLLAELLPEALFSVDRSKAQAAQNAASTGEVDILLVDDAFQHYGLHRDLDIVTYDAGVPENQLKPFPLGLLREPVSALSRADVIIITRSDFARDLSSIRRRLKRINDRAEHYHARFVADMLIGRERSLPVKYLEDKSVFLFAGIGNFGVLKKQVSALCSDLDEAWELADHQRYDEKLLIELKEAADGHDSDLILTTAKDWVKLGNFDFGREIYYLTQSVDLDPGEEKLVSFIQESFKLGKQSV